MLREYPNDSASRDQEGNLFEGVADNCVEDRPYSPAAELVDALNKRTVEEMLVERRAGN